MWNKWQDGMKKLMEKMNKETMLILFLSGILIFVILLPTDKNSSSYDKKSGTSAAGEQTAITGNTAETGFSSISYKEELENELEEFLSGVAGVGEVKVMIYMKNSQEYIVEKDSSTTGSENSDSRETTKDETTVYTVNGAGEQVPFISQTISPGVDGVVVAAKGAGQEAVRLQIVHLVMALFGLDANKVEVLVLQ